MALPTYAELCQSVRSLGLPCQVLGRTRFNDPVLCLDTGRSQDPAVLVTAGSHANEVAGVLAALAFLRMPVAGAHVYLVPCRDPLGWDGIRACLHRAAGAPMPVNSHQEAVRALGSCGELIHDRDGVVVGTVNRDLAVATISPDHPRAPRVRMMLEEVLANDPALPRALAGRLLLLPSSAHRSAGDPYGPGAATTIYVDAAGECGNMNRFFNRADPPMEVAVIRALADRVQPRLTVDLHEGIGDAFYIYLHSNPDGPGRRLASVALAHHTERGWPLATYASLAPRFAHYAPYISELAPGLLRFIPPTGADSALGGYCAQYGAAMTTESGMEAPLSQRALWSEAALRAVITAYLDGARHAP